MTEADKRDVWGSREKAVEKLAPLLRTGQLRVDDVIRMAWEYGYGYVPPSQKEKTV